MKWSRARFLHTNLGCRLLFYTKNWVENSIIAGNFSSYNWLISEVPVWYSFQNPRERFWKWHGGLLLQFWLENFPCNILWMNAKNLLPFILRITTIFRHHFPLSVYGINELTFNMEKNANVSLTCPNCRAWCFSMTWIP